jgi:hypothetical protein
MGVDQFLAVKATADGRSGMPATRPWAVGNVSAAGNTSR